MTNDSHVRKALATSTWELPTSDSEHENASTKVDETEVVPIPVEKVSLLQGRKLKTLGTLLWRRHKLKVFRMDLP